MKGKKYRRSQHAVKTIYEKYFGIRRPYQILVDAPFCIDALKKKVTPAEAMQEVFGGPVKLMTTPCIMSELRKYDKKCNDGAAFVARRFESRNCRHDDNKLSGADCLKDLIGKNNPHHYCVASQNSKLRKAIRKVYGVPTVYILRDTVLMEPPTEKTLKMVKSKEERKLLKPAQQDIKLLKKLKKVKTETAVLATEDKQESTLLLPASSSQTPKKKKKKVKGGPNPLACKVKKSKLDQPQQAQVNKAKKKPRKRRPKKPKTTE